MANEQTVREKASAAYNVYVREVVAGGGVPEDFATYLDAYGWDQAEVMEEIEDEPTVPLRHCLVCEERGEEHIPEGWEE